jgi:hypothetical protein
MKNKALRPVWRGEREEREAASARAALAAALRLLLVGRLEKAA